MTRVWSVIWLWLCGTGALAQEQVFIQVEAQPSLAEGMAAAEGYDGRLDGISGFELGGSWYAIALGPFDRDVAQTQLTRLRRMGRIPGDSYLTTRSDYGARFFPADEAAAGAPEPVALPEMSAGDESPAEARRSERSLSRDERQLVQTALEDAGVYAGPIDADFGPGTRRAMADWQAANGHEPTGVLTTPQRTALIDAYRAMLDELGMQRVEDGEAGIALAMPTEAVFRAAAEGPFVRYQPTGDLPARVLLISQRGGPEDLAGLYDIMQTLSVVPVDGPRALRANAFEIEGRGDEIVSTTWAELRDGEIKGFALVWPADDERRRTRVLARMRESFERLPGVLPEVDGADTPAPDLLSGLDVRTPERDRTGFYVDDSGAVLTTAEAVRSCRRVTLDESVDAEVTAADEALGLALLRPSSSLSPIRHARFRASMPSAQSEIAVAGYPYGGVLAAPSLNFGHLVEPRDLAGDASRSRLDLAAEPGETGGPVFGNDGAVLGVLVPHDSGSRELPESVSFAAAVGPVAEFLTAAGLSPEAVDGGDQVPPEELTRLAADMTVLVRCWN